MSADKLEAVKQRPEYETLVRTRRRVVWTLSILMMAVYYAYILIIAFVPETLGVKIGDGPITLGIVVGLGVIFFSFLLTGIYVRIANKTLEPITEELHQHIRDQTESVSGESNHAK